MLSFAYPSLIAFIIFLAIGFAAAFFAFIIFFIIAIVVVFVFSLDVGRFVRSGLSSR